MDREKQESEELTGTPAPLSTDGMTDSQSRDTEAGKDVGGSQESEEVTGTPAPLSTDGMTDSQSKDTEAGKDVRWSHVLACFSSRGELQQPMLASSRIKYTCISASEALIALGTSSGAVHVFAKNNHRHMQLIPGDKDGSIVQVSLGPEANTVGYATSKGLVHIYLLKLDKRSGPEKLRSTADHKGARITCLAWNQQGDRLFVGDDLGHVSSANISLGTKELFRQSSDVIMRLDKPVIQIDTWKDLMLVSATDRTYIGSSTKHQYTHIGSKARDGLYGACFLPPVSEGGDAMIYCSRPGSRMWEVHRDGQVLNTHQFKGLLAVPPLPIVDSLSTKDYHTATQECSQMSINFPRLVTVSNRFLATVNDVGLFIFDPAEVKVILWNDKVKDIVDWTIFKSEIFILRENTVIKMELLPIVKVVARLVSDEKWRLAGQLCVIYSDTIRSAMSRVILPVVTLTDIRNHLLEDADQKLTSKLTDLLAHVEDSFIPETPLSNSQRVSYTYHQNELGIYVINTNKANHNDDKVVTKTGYPKEVVKINSSSNTTIEELEYAAPDPKPLAHNDSTTGKIGDSKHSEQYEDIPIIHISPDTELLIEAVQDTEYAAVVSPTSKKGKYRGKKMKPARIVLDDGSILNGKQRKEKTISHHKTKSISEDLKLTFEADAFQNAQENYSGSTEKTRDFTLKEVNTESSPKAETLGSENVICQPELTADKDTTIFREISPKRVLLGVKEKVSGTVKTRTKSVLQTIKDKKLALKQQAKSLDGVGILVYHKQGENDNYFIQGEVKMSTGIAPETETGKKQEFDISELEQLTLQTKEILESLSVACNAAETKEVLRIWVDCLHRTSQEYYNLFLIRDNTPSIEDNSKTKVVADGVAVASNGATNVPKQGSTPHCFNMVENPRCFLSYKALLCDSNILSIAEEMAYLCVEHEIYGDVHDFSHTENSDRPPSNFAAFLGQYYFLLELNLIRLWKKFSSNQSVSSRGECVTLLSFIKEAHGLEMLISTDKSNTSEEMAQKLSSLDTALLLASFDQLYTKSPGLMLEVAAKIPSVEPRDVWCIVQLHDHEDHVHHMITFLDLRLANSVDRSHCLHQILEDSALTLAWFEAQLLHGHEGNMPVKCQCGKPWPKSHMTTWRRESTMASILEGSSKYALSMKDLCYSYGYWQGYVQLSCTENMVIDKDSIFSMVLHLADLSLFSKYKDLRPETSTEWASVVNRMTTLKPATSGDSSRPTQCLNCGMVNTTAQCSPGEDSTVAVTWENVALMMLEDLGSQQTLSILKTSSIPQGSLSEDFYQQCLLTSLLHRRQRVNAERLLEKVDTYLWSSRPISCPPRVLAIDQEVDDSTDNNGTDLTTSST